MKLWTFQKKKVRGKLRAIGTEIDVDSNHDHLISIGENYYVIEIYAPNNTIYYAESTSGALMGKDLDIIKHSIKEAGKEMMKIQIKNARLQQEVCILVDNESFWKHIK